MFQIIKQILLLDKGNLSKCKMQILSNNFIYYLALCERVVHSLIFQTNEFCMELTRL